MVAPAVRSIAPPSPAQRPMQCMEVWGGNMAGDTGFTMPGLDLWVGSRPLGNSRIDGGDLHLLSSCASGRITRWMLADVCGQAPLFAELGAALRSLLVANINRIQQARLIEQVHDQMLALAEAGGFATALVGTYFSPTRTLSLCNLGHAPPLIYRAKTAAWEICKTTPRIAPTDATDSEPPLGVMGVSEYHFFDAKLAPGDMVLSYSNAITEAENENGRTLGVSGLIQTLDCVANMRPAEIVPELLRRTSVEASQDLTMVLCRATERGVSLTNNLLAPFRLFGSVSDQTRLE